MEIAFEEKVSDLSDKNLTFMVEALNIQMRDHFAVKWGFEPWPCKSYKTLVGLPIGTFWPIAILNDINAPDAAGYHDFAAGLVYGRVKWDGTFDGTSVTASHEALELRADPYCNKWISIGPTKQVALEVCDPCEGDTYSIDVKIFNEKRAVKVSDFVLPAYFQKGAARPYTYLDSIDRNVFDLGLSRNGGGYLLVRDKGQVVDYWGRKLFGKKKAPEGFSKGKDPLSRFSKRFNNSSIITDI